MKDHPGIVEASKRKCLNDTDIFWVVFFWAKAK